MMHSRRSAVAYEVERTMRTIFKRCVECPPGTPSCPTCASNEICSLVPQDCDQCARSTCIANPNSANTAPQNGGPNVGAIAGGVVSGVVAVGLAVFLLWYFYIRKRRLQQELEAEQWEDDIAQHKSRHFSQMQTDAASTRTRASLATSILSRASNIIQIAYIPGITNRNGGHETPVPPIPAAFRSDAPNSPNTPLSGNGEALFFRPSDLRDSVASSFVSARSRPGNRDTQYTMKSITPSLARSSIASDIYHNDATAEPMPATTVVRGLPRMVSVKTSKSNNSSSSDSSPAVTPPIPQGPQVMVPGGGATSTVRARATPNSLVSKGHASKGRFPIKRPPSSADNAPAVSSPLVGSTEDTDRASSGDEDEHARARKSLVTGMKPATDQQSIDSPFYDASEDPPRAQTSPKLNPYATMASSIGHTKQGSLSVGGLSAVIEEATKRASRSPSHDGLGGKRDSSLSSSQPASTMPAELEAVEATKETKKEESPFGDEHAAE